MAKTKTKKTKAAEAVAEAVKEVATDAAQEYKDMCDELGKKSAEFQRASKVSSAKHLRNAIRAIRYVIEELER